MSERRREAAAELEELIHRIQEAHPCRYGKFQAAAGEK
jgi:hypothetical protein